MLSLYYRIWIDLIKRAKSRSENRENWPKMTMIFMTVAMSLNLSLFMSILEKHILERPFYDIELNFLSKHLSNVVSFMILFVLPCALINYFLIFYRHRYKKLLEKYPSKDGKLFLAYFFISMLLPLVLLIIGIATGKIGISL